MWVAKPAHANTKAPSAGVTALPLPLLHPRRRRRRRLWPTSIPRLLESKVCGSPPARPGPHPSAAAELQESNRRGRRLFWAPLPEPTRLLHLPRWESGGLEATTERRRGPSGRGHGRPRRSLAPLAAHLLGRAGRGELQVGGGGVDGRTISSAAEPKEKRGGTGGANHGRGCAGRASEPWRSKRGAHNPPVAGSSRASKSSPPPLSPCLHG